VSGDTNTPVFPLSGIVGRVGLLGGQPCADVSGDENNPIYPVSGIVGRGGRGRVALVGAGWSVLAKPGLSHAIQCRSTFDRGFPLVQPGTAPATRLVSSRVCARSPKLLSVGCCRTGWARVLSTELLRSRLGSEGNRDSLPGVPSHRFSTIRLMAVTPLGYKNRIPAQRWASPLKASQLTRSTQCRVLSDVVGAAERPGSGWSVFAKPILFHALLGFHVDRHSTGASGWSSLVQPRPPEWRRRGPDPRLRKPPSIAVCRT